MVGPTSASYGAVKVKLLKDGKVLTSDDFAAYEYLQISVVCDTDGTQFLFYNQRYDLVRGLNVLRFSQEVLGAQINETSYTAEGWLWFQTNPAQAGTEYTLWLDQMIGVYPAGGGEEDGNFDLLNGFETGQDSSIWVSGGVTNTATNARGRHGGTLYDLRRLAGDLGLHAERRRRDDPRGLCRIRPF